jgi:epoxide hydrolase-like predicted phosphatase
MGDRHGLILDYGGVLTSSPFTSFAAFCAVEGLPADAVQARFRDDERSRELLAGLETGALPSAEFETAFAAQLGVAPDNLLQRMFGGMEPDMAMLDGVRALRRPGVRMSILSNSVGIQAVYDRDGLAALFDDWVISSEVGLRKPEPEIYELAAQRLGLEPAQCVYVDDLPPNLKTARALGMATVLHRGDAAATLAEIREHLAVRSPLPPRPTSP